MTEDNGDGEDSGHPGYVVSNSMCMERMGHLETLTSERIVSMENKILFTVKVSTLLVGLAITLLQLGLHFFG